MKATRIPKAGEFVKLVSTRYAEDKGLILEVTDETHEESSGIPNTTEYIQGIVVNEHPSYKIGWYVCRMASYEILVNTYSLVAKKIGIAEDTNKGIYQVLECREIPIKEGFCSIVKQVVTTMGGNILYLPAIKAYKKGQIINPTKVVQEYTNFRTSYCNGK